MAIVALTLSTTACGKVTGTIGGKKKLPENDKLCNSFIAPSVDFQIFELLHFQIAYAIPYLRRLYGGKETYCNEWDQAHRIPASW